MIKCGTRVYMMLRDIEKVAEAKGKGFSLQYTKAHQNSDKYVWILNYENKEGLNVNIACDILDIALESFLDEHSDRI